MLKYKIKFGPHVVEAEDFKSAMACAIACAYIYARVEVWIGHHFVWRNEN